MKLKGNLNHMLLIMCDCHSLMSVWWLKSIIHFSTLAYAFHPTPLLAHPSCLWWLWVSFSCTKYPSINFSALFLVLERKWFLCSYEDKRFKNYGSICKVSPLGDIGMFLWVSKNNCSMKDDKVSVQMHFSKLFYSLVWDALNIIYTQILPVT